MTREGLSLRLELWPAEHRGSMTKICRVALLTGFTLLGLTQNLSAQDTPVTADGFLDPKIAALLLGAFLALVSNQVLEHRISDI